MNKFEVIKKYGYKIDECVNRISNSYNVYAYHPGTSGGSAGYNVSAGKDTEVVLENCLKEVIDLIENDNAYSGLEKKEVIDIVASEIHNRLKSVNVQKGKREYRKAAAESIGGDFIGLFILMGIILFIGWIFGWIS